VVRLQVLVRNCSALQRVQTGSMAYPASYSMGKGGSFPGVKRTRCEADNALPSSAEVKKYCSFTSTTPSVFMEWAETIPFYAVCFLLGNYPASGVYMPKFRNTLFHLHMQVYVSRMNIQHTEHGESLKSSILFYFKCS